MFRRFEPSTPGLKTLMQAGPSRLLTDKASRPFRREALSVSHWAVYFSQNHQDIGDKQQPP
jgi:hypothetical protein